MNLYEYDELKIYRGNEIKINKKITVTIPTLDQIEKFDERRYFNAIHNLTSVGADMKWQLWEIGQDYTKIEDYDLFIKLTSQILGSRKKLYDDIKKNPDIYNDINFNEEDLENLLINPLQLILKNIDLANFVPCLEKENLIILYDAENDITIDRYVYTRIVEAVRKIHGLKRNNQTPANESTKMDLIEDARDEYLMAQKKPYKSLLLPLVSTIQVYCGQIGDNNIWNMPISALFEITKRIGKVQDAQMLLQGAYSGFANLKGVDKTRLNMFGDI